MNFTINRDTLLLNLTHVSKALSAKVQMPGLSGIKFNVNKKVSKLYEKFFFFYKNAFFADRFLPAGHVISENEARKFYHNYKWAFRKDFSEQSDYYSFDKVKNFIYTEMVRLESFGLKELIENPPSVSIIWKKKSPQILKHGSLDPLSPEEMERRKREFLASQPRNELFSENELKEGRKANWLYDLLI